MDENTTSAETIGVQAADYCDENGHTGRLRGALTHAVAGAWRLVSIEDRKPDGEMVYWMGSRPTGLIIYDASGHMSVQFMRDPRPIFTTTYNRASSDEVKSAYEGYFAYFGRYQVDEEKGIITHQLQGSLRPQEVGIDYLRNFQISDNRLILSMTVPGKNGEWHRTLTWERLR